MGLQDRLPGWFRLSVLPLLLPVLAAVYTAAHWNTLPQRFPIHWGFNGQPNAWTTRTPLHVFGVLIFAEGLCLWLVAMAVIGYRGSRPSQGRHATLKLVFGIEWLTAIVFSGVGFGELVRFPPWLLPVVAVPATIALVAFAWRDYSKPARAGVPLDRTPDEYWSVGDIYNNPNDPALMVPKRQGIGFTFNFGNPRAKRVVGGLGAAFVALVVFLFLSLQ